MLALLLVLIVLAIVIPFPPTNPNAIWAVRIALIVVLLLWLFVGDGWQLLINSHAGR
jgi:uncharacterized membrane protein